MALRIDPVRPNARPTGFSYVLRRQTASKICHTVNATSPKAVTHSRISPTTVSANASSAAYFVSAPAAR
jgi:hypothetical protein